MSQNATTFQTSSMPVMTSSIKENFTTLSQLTSATKPTSVALTESQLKGFVTQQTVTSEPTSPKESLENTSAGEFQSIQGSFKNAVTQRGVRVSAFRDTRACLTEGERGQKLSKFA